MSLNSIRNLSMRLQRRSINFLEEYNKFSNYFDKDQNPFYNEKCFNHIIKQKLCRKCYICKGTGWISNNANNANNANNIGININLDICLVCTGTGMV